MFNAVRALLNVPRAHVPEAKKGHRFARECRVGANARAGGTGGTPEWTLYVSAPLSLVDRCAPGEPVALAIWPIRAA